MDYKHIDLALGKSGPPHPLQSSLSKSKRDESLAAALFFPDREIPQGELAEWAVVLIDLGKVAATRAAVAAVESALRATHRERGEAKFVEKVLAELHCWLQSPQKTEDLQRLGDLWWSLTRNPPEAACTPLVDAAVMAWLVAGYDPEGWGDPPNDPSQLPRWLSEAANNVRAIVDVFSLVQQAVELNQHDLLVADVRKAMKTWRDQEFPDTH